MIARELQNKLLRTLSTLGEAQLAIDEVSTAVHDQQPPDIEPPIWWWPLDELTARISGIMTSVEQIAAAMEEDL